jgi:hypothetical protein
MLPIDGSFLYQTGKQVHPLSELQAGTKLADAFLPILVGEYALDVLVNKSVYQLKTSQADGLAVLSVLERIKNRINLEDKEATVGWQDHNALVTSLTRFEAVFAAELRVSSLYLMTPKKGLDIAAAVSDGLASFPDDLAKKVPGAVADARQAMKCIVYELPTAAGFHLHRANESVLHCFYDAVTEGAPRPQNRNMGDYAERLIGSIRRECLDHIVVFGEAHLRRILEAYTDYYNELRTHLSLSKESPGHRPVQRYGQLAARPILGGLHHQYCRM